MGVLLDPSAMPRAVVCGSPGFDDEATLWHCLDSLRDRFGGPFEVLSGGARGAGTLGEECAVCRPAPLTKSGEMPITGALAESCWANEMSRWAAKPFQRSSRVCHSRST